MLGDKIAIDVEFLTSLGRVSGRPLLLATEPFLPNRSFTKMTLFTIKHCSRCHAQQLYNDNAIAPLT